nr:hypothetical protein [Burkholderia pyrrocinia]
MNAIKERIRYDANACGGDVESHSLRHHIEALPGGVLHIGFRANGRPVAVTVSFDDAAFDTCTQWDASQKQLALGRLADGFPRMMSTRNPATLAGDYHIERFRLGNAAPIHSGTTQSARAQRALCVCARVA